jgi:hypothetical protein
MIRRAIAASLVATSLLVGAAHAAPGRDPQADQGTGYFENEYGVGTCDADAPVSDNMPSSSDCGHVNGDSDSNQGGNVGD